jgi:ankyrin repeat protein
MDQASWNPALWSGSPPYATASFCLPEPGARNILRSAESISDAQWPLSLESAELTSLTHTMMEPTPQAMVLGQEHNMSYFSKSMIEMFTRMLPEVETDFRSIEITQKHLSRYPVGTLCHPETVKLLRNQSINHQMLHMVVHRLINDENAILALQDPTTGNDELFKAGVDYIFSFRSSILAQFIDLTPQPYRDALEQGLFCAAIEAGSVRGLKNLLSRGFNARVVLKFGHKKCYPLERSCEKREVEIARILLKRYGCPEGFHWDSLVGYIAPPERCSHHDPGLIEIIRLFLEHGAKMSTTLARYIFKHCDAELFLATSADPNDHSYGSVVLKGDMARAVRHADHYHSLPMKIRIILEHKHPNGVQASRAWNEALTTSLSIAALTAQFELISIFLAVGAQANTDCLNNAAQSKSIEVFTFFLDFGLDPNARSSLFTFPPASQQSGVMQPVADSTSLSLCIEHKFVEALNLLEQRGYLAKVGDDEASLQISLEAACRVGDIELVSKILSFRQDSRMYSLETAVTAAMESGEQKIVEYLISHGFKPDPETLFLAVKNKHKTLASSLLHVAQFGIGDFHIWRNTLYEAVQWDDANFIEELFRIGGSHGFKPDHEALFLAVRMKQRTLASLLVHVVRLKEHYLDKRHDILLEAVCWSDASFIRDLIQAGASMNRHVPFSLLGREAWNVEGFSEDDDLYLDWLASPLSAAILRGDSGIIHLLLNSGARLNSYDSYSKKRWDHDMPKLTALTACVIKSDCSLLQELLHRGADPFDNAAIHMAVEVGNETIVRVLLNAFHKSYPTGAKSFASDALVLALRNKDLQLLELLTPFADMYEEDDDRFILDRSAVSLAIRLSASGFHRALCLFLQHCKDLNTTIEIYEDRTTPLLLAVQSGSLKTVEELIEAGADHSLPALWGLSRTPLQAAVEKGSEEIINYLLQKGVDPNEASSPRAGATALQLAAIKGFIGIAVTLLANGAKVNAKPAMIDGRTAFEGATEHGHIEMMLYLVQNGADLHMDDEQQFRRAIRFAEKNSQHAAKRLAEKLFQTTQKYGGTQSIIADEAETVGFDSDMFDEFLE